MFHQVEYQKYLGYRVLLEPKKKKRNINEKVGKMGGNGSKATVLENMIKNFKKGFDGDYVKKAEC